MTEKDEDLMGRYIYEVVRRVSKEQRNEIAMELRELIEDMVADSDMKSVLKKLGDPVVFARQYRDESRYVISPEYYDNYVWVLKIVIAGVLISSVVSAIIEGIVERAWTGNIIGDMISNTLVSFACVFGVVTFIFAVLERQRVKVELKKESVWSVKDLENNFAGEKNTWKPDLLAPVPNKKALISRADSMVSIVFIVLFSGAFLFAPHLFGAYVFEEKEIVKIIPIFNLEKWNIIVPLLLVSFSIGFIDAMIRLVTGCYCKMVMVSNIIAEVMQLALGIIVLKYLPFWNPAFVDEVWSEFGAKAVSKGDIFYYYGIDMFSDIILAIMFIAAFVEIGTTIYKTIRYGIDR